MTVPSAASALGTAEVIASANPVANSIYLCANLGLLSAARNEVEQTPHIVLDAHLVAVLLSDFGGCADQIPSESAQMPSNNMSDSAKRKGVCT
jgi:hypothetical protein